MSRALVSSLALLVAAAAGCSAPPKPPSVPRAAPREGVARAPSPAPAPIAVSPAPAPTPLEPGFAPPPPGLTDPVPPSIRKRVSEQRAEIRDMHALASVVGDQRGRARALGEVIAREQELGAIDGALAVPDSPTLDVAVTGLVRLETRIGVLHEALRAAHPSPDAPKLKE